MHSNTPPVASGQPGLPSQPAYTPVDMLPVTKVPALDTIDRYAVDKSVGAVVGKSPSVEVACSSSVRDLADSIIQGYARFISRFIGAEDVAFFVTRHAAFATGPDATRYAVCAFAVGSGDAATYTVHEFNEGQRDQNEVQFILELGLGSGPENGEAQQADTQEDKFALSVQHTSSGTLQLRFSYPRRLIPDAAVQQLLNTLSAHLVQSSPSLSLKTPLPELSILNFPPLMIPPSRNPEQDINLNVQSAPPPALLHAAFEGWARRKPDAIALDFVHSLSSAQSPAEHSILTYAALNAAASNLASYIRTLWSDSDLQTDNARIVPVYLSTSPELYISYLAVLKAGCAFSPIPLDAPEQRIQDILHDIQSPIILGAGSEPSLGPWRSEMQGSDTIKRTWIDVTEVSRWKEMRGDHPRLQLPSQDTLEDLEIKDDQTAYLFFTSGSTGKPKGVQVSHLAVTCSIASHSTAIPLPGDNQGDFRWFQFASPTFDPSLMEIFVTLSNGATLCSADRSLTLTDIESAVNEARATVMMATPSLAALLRPSRLTTLQSLWTMGEKLNRTVIDNFAAKPEPNGSPTSRMLVNAYGPTEGAINCTFLAPVDYAVRGSIIGSALPTCAMLILDPDQRNPTPVPSGLAGELAIAGPQVSKGYLNRPEETAKSFVYSSEFGYLYRTGDMARIVWDENGSEVIEFLGRITTDQVKISGRRLELGEIESVLATVDDVTEIVAVVSARDNTPGSEQIVACLVTKATSRSAREKIVRDAQESTLRHLSSYMCPSIYAFFDSLPRSSSGKVDRKTIAVRLQRGGDRGVEIFLPPKAGMSNGVHDDWDETEDETVLALQDLVVRLIAESTDEDATTIKAGSDLYTLGLDSLGAMRFLQKLRDQSIYDLSVADVLLSGTPKGLVSIIARRHQENGTAQVNGSPELNHSQEPLGERLALFSSKNHPVCAERLGLNPCQIQKVLPTTATQSGMITSLLRSSSDSASSSRTYIYHSVIPLQPHVDVERMLTAWDTVVSEYDSFRTVFCLVDDDLAPFAQCILAPGAASRPEWNICSAKDTSEESLHKAFQDAEGQIRLKTPPWKLSLITTPEKRLIILSMFHGIFDGGSLQLLLEDVASVYNSNGLAERTSLEHIVKHHFGADHEAASVFWAKHLDQYSPVAFPSLTPQRPPAVKTVGYVEITSKISHADLKKRSKNISSTPLAVLQSAWGSILLAYTGTQDQDVTIGSVVSGRLDRDSESCIGPTYSVIPLRLSVNQIARGLDDVCTNKSVARYLTSFGAQALSHLQLSLGSTVTADGRLPYDTLLAYQDFNAGSHASGTAGSGPWGSVDHPAMAHDFAVMIEVWPCSDSSLTFRATYNDSHLDAEGARIMLSEMDDIVRYILDEPEGNFLDALSHTGSSLKSSFNPVSRCVDEVSEGVLIHSWFEDHAASKPHDPALIFKYDLDDLEDPANITWTYGEVNAMADRLADHLSEICGPLANVPVPLCIEKSPAVYIAILAILKAGGAWCPIDTLSPAQRRHDLIARTGAKVLLVSSDDPAQTEEAVPSSVELVDVAQYTKDAPLLANGVHQKSPRVKNSPDDMAYLIWTSGTTGAPKGVPITHSAAVSAMKSLHRDIPTDVSGGAIRCLQFSQYTFDVSIQDMFYTWGIGGVLISATREIMLGSFSKLANTTKATHAHLTPAFAAGIPRKSCETLQVITMIGEKLTPSVAEDWGTDMRAFNTYGPAEATIVSTIREFGNEHKNIKSANIGWPMDTVSVYVMKNRRTIMKNAVGELALGGPQLSPGYLRQEDVTKAKYIYNEEAGQTLYYTGDLVRMLSDGSLEYINRVDDQVKLAGIRIELSEISYSLGGCHPLVENIETLVLTRPDRPNQVVVAFLSAPGAIRPEQGGELVLLDDTALEIAQAANEKAQSTLPDNMIPSVYLVIRSIPKTASAKTDRRALQAAYATVDIDDWEKRLNPETAAAAQSPDDPEYAATIAQVIDMISSLAGISSAGISRTSRMHSLGIDSIRAVRLASKMRKAGYQFSVLDLLNCVTVQDLMKLISKKTEKPQSDVFDVNGFNDKWHPAISDKVQEEFFTVRATTIQESLLSETMGTYDMYWSNHFFSLEQAVDVIRLKQAWLAVAQKTEALRTGFMPVAEVSKGNNSGTLDFSLLQLIYKVPSVDWEYVNCSTEDYVELRDARIKDVMMKHQTQYFRNPPWAVTVFDKDGERVMILTIHHSLHDEPSLRLIMDDVQAAYAYKPPSRLQLTNALSIVLPNEQKANATHNFWKSELEKFAELDVPVWPDLTGVRAQPAAVPERKLLIAEVPLTEPATKLQSAAAELGVSSVASIIRAAWGYVSVSYLGIPATVFAETLSDRVLHADLEDGVGPLISVVPIPFCPKGSARELLEEQHRLSVQSWKYRHVPARDVRKMLRRPRGEALYPAVFNFHAESDVSETSPTIWSETEDEVGLHVEHQMAFNVFQRPDGSFLLEACADSRVMNQEQLAVFVRQVDGLVSAMLAYPDKPLMEVVDHLSHDLLSVSNRPVSEEVANSVHSAPTYWLERNAREHPDWTAVEVASSISPDGIVKETMSYSKLNAEANRVAAYLASLGHKNRMIAVCTGRNLPSYPIIAGIFKSGNAYLPIVEDLPVDRKLFLAEDADCPIVFTETTLSDSFSRVSDNCSVICIDDPQFQKSVESMPVEDRDYQSGPDDLAYLLFTSGSTGKPKGVMVTRGNLSSFIESFSEFATTAAPITFELGGKGRYLAQASRAFDPHLLEMLFPWRHGMTTATAPREMILDDLHSTMSKWGITHASFVPSIVDQANLTPHDCPSLVFMTVGGEKITQKTLDTWSTSRVALVNAYGPTEVTIGCTFARVGKYTNMRNIGAPLTSCVGHVFIPGTQHYALRGQTGELCFSGDIVAKGYLNRPDATGFCDGPRGEKMYRTGDIGRLMPDNSVEYLGRGDDQTKIRGQRLELGEVSEVLRSSSPIPIDVVTSVAQHPGLARVQLISFFARAGARQRDQKEVSLVQSDLATLGKELQEICQKKLPGYMVPELILPVTHIPLAQMSAKINVKELHALFASLPLDLILQGNKWTAEGGAASSRPLTADEEAVVKEICSVIPVDASILGALTNIFEVGLDSLSAIGLSIRLRKIGYAATVALVMSNPVIEQLARLPRMSPPVSNGDPAASKLHQRLADLDAQYRRSCPADVDLSTVSSVRPCLPLQEGLVARSINSEGDQLYVNHVVLQLAGHVDAGNLKAAWEKVVYDNEIMRSAFAPLDNEMVQVVFSAGSSQIQWTDEEYENLEEALSRRKSQEGNVSREIISNICSVPPVRFHFARSSNGGQPLALFIAIHHALYDGESFTMLMQDVASRYEGKPVPTRGSPSDFIEHVYGLGSDKAKEYWVQYLAGYSPTLFRTEFGSLEQPKSVQRRASNKLSELEQCAANLQATVSSLIQALFALLLADTVGVSDVTYGLVLSGRAISVPGADTVLLPCITTIPGRLNTNNLSTVSEVVQSVQKSTAKSLDFQHTSLRHIQRWIKSESPLFDCLFSYIRATSPAAHSLWREFDSHMPAEYPVAVEVEANHELDTVSLNGLFSSAFTSSHNGEELLEKMDAVLSSVVAGESLSLDNFNLSTSQAPGTRSTTLKWDETTWSSVETELRDITASFCGLATSDVSKGASFLSLGIDSVTAIQFARKLREAGMQVTSSDVMRFSCIGALAQHIERRSSEAPQTNGVEESQPTSIPVAEYQKHIRALNDDDSISTVFECTPLQSGMITQTISSDGQVYVHPHAIRLTDNADIPRLKDALLEVIQANDILRTSFHLIGELGPSWVGAVHERPPFEWDEVELPSGADVPSQVAALYSFSDEASFEAPPIRSVLVHQPEGKVLVIVMHHALYDGASLPFFFEDLATIYNGNNIPDRPQFSKTVGLILGSQEESCNFWVSKLSNYEVTEIPRLPASESSSGMLLRKRRLDIDLPAAIQSCKEMEVTVQNISLLAYSKVLAHLVGKRDVVFGQVLAGRSLSTPEAERTIGPLFNTVAQRVTFEPKFLSNKSMAQRLQQLTTDAQGHQHAPLRVVQNALRQANGLKSASLFDTLFVFMKSADLEGSVLEQQNIWRPYESDDSAALTEHKLNVEVDHAHDGIHVTASCNGQYMTQNMLDGFVDEFGAVLRDIIEHPARCATVMPERLGELPLRLSVTGSEVNSDEDVDGPPHEAVIQAVLSDISGLSKENIKPTTSIFSIGLDSLSAIRIASICRKKGLKTSVADILQGGTLRGISQRVRPTSEQAPKAHGSLIADYDSVERAVLERLQLGKESVETILPCLGGQFFHLASWLKSGRKLFEPAWPYFSSERIDSVKLEQAWSQLRQRHPVLRTCFVALSPSEAVQVVVKEAMRDGDVFKVIESSDPIAEVAKAQAREEALRPSSLFVPPVRLRLMKAGDRDGILVLVNHAAYDAWTMPMFVSELANLYRGEPLDTNPDFPAFVDFSVRSLRGLDEKTFWTSAVGSGTPTLVKGNKSDAGQASDQLFVSAWEQVKNLSKLETACRSVGLSLQTVVLLAISRCLSRNTGAKNPVMGLYQTGRSASFTDIEKLSGPCLNVNPFAVPDAVSAGSLLDKAQAVQSALAERIFFEQSSLRDVLGWTGNGNGAPLFNTWVNLLWMQNAMPSAADASPDSEAIDHTDLFLPLRIGVPTDFIPAEPLDSQDTAVSALDTSFLPDQNIFIDVGPDPKTDSIGFGVRVEGGVLTEDEVLRLVSEIGYEIETVVSSLH
ncbi:hypothetical protein ATEG_05073 [Aspergillus terreus NIH2624]|uniref:Nonribosomal peptide synthetase sidC n=1 Tax=Aspergillus terreus (strain NIH 2624 / FGSC A1156) TaxID=341663 RepID=Q0CML1_ASPTN|nr:uncharacterized protein ATEG_05073 [Aspergillus terreus NIH2624]EAU34142.1 hypothetical protein ATEG_05073 [Aspergillus terreus NIH2624]